jgi:hypothetical protein
LGAGPAYLEELRWQQRKEDMIHPRGVEQTQLEGSSADLGTLPEGRGGDRFSAPLGSSRSGRLRFTGGAHGVVIRADSNMRGLYSASFLPRIPAVVVRGGEVKIRCPRPWMDERIDVRSSRRAEVALNATIPWEIEIRGGASRLLADLLDVQLGALAIEGGVGRVEVVLPIPVGTATVVFHGGASNLAIHRPAGVPARLCVEGGATHLRFDDRSIGAAGKRVDLRGYGYDGAIGRYAIAVTGGANNLSVDGWRGPKERGWSAPA